MYGTNQIITKRPLMAFSQGMLFSFSFSLYTASDEKIIIQQAPETPTDLKADAVDQGGLNAQGDLLVKLGGPETSFTVLMRGSSGRAFFWITMWLLKNSY